MALGGHAPGAAHHAVHQRFGGIAEVIADHHQRDGAGNIGRRDPQYIGLLELAQRDHERFRVVHIDTVELARQFVPQLLARQRVVERARVQQLIQQQRMPGDGMADPGARGGQLDQLLPRRGIFRQQGQIDVAAGDGLDHFEDAFQRRDGRLRARRGADQLWQHTVQLGLAPGCQLADRCSLPE